MTSKYVFTELDRLHGKRVGLMKDESDFRCYECVDFSFYERGADARDADKRCSYCGGFVFIAPAAIVEIEAVKPVRPVNLAKPHAQHIDYVTIAYHLGRRLEDVSFAYDKARQRIAELEAQLAERENVALLGL
ncbi:hypothetical protein OG436_14070 [Streptomyces caniferus]|uniref:hypothetical protein n=1 Tax=Streptomyces caniferus TaxID=285557 RepID=UPI002E2A1901|nr:hypothetical protein [Streptomyces caniferus]